MKENKLIEMSNKVEQLGSILQKVISELNNLKDLSIGLTELVKLLPDYDEALEKMKENLQKDKEQKEKQKE
jgi:predicted ATP-grasp superfamily ATP-dependent carboligase|tara:strand:+ start:300 stop:512 length:213 start_codon:yes stop_codon:yes gene_type:complete